MIIAIDFDGTCVTHDYPDVGGDVGAVQVIKKLVAHGIPLFGVNKNPDQHTWTKSPKPYAHIYIDDAALGVPLMRPKNGKRPYVHWPAVAELLGLEYEGDPTP